MLRETGKYLNLCIIYVCKTWYYVEYSTKVFSYPFSKLKEDKKRKTYYRMMRRYLYLIVITSRDQFPKGFSNFFIVVYIYR